MILEVFSSIKLSNFVTKARVIDLVLRKRSQLYPNTDIIIFAV